MVTNEWIVEEIEGEERDIVDVHQFDTLPPALRYAAELRAEGKEVEVGLTRDVWNNYDGDLDDRQWAYLEDGVLPAKFDGGATVPKRFLAEVARFTPTCLDTYEPKALK